MGEDPNSSSEPINTSLKNILTGAVVSFLGFAIMRGAGLGEKVLITRFFDPSRYGQVVLVVSLLSLATMLASLGLRTGIVRYLPRYESKHNQGGIVSTSLKLAGVASIVLSVLVFLLAEWVSTIVFNDPSLTGLLQVIAFGIPLAVFGQLSASVARGMKDARSKNLIENICFPITRVSLIGVVLLISLETAGIAGAYVGGYAVMALLGAGYLYTVFGASFGPDFEGSRLLRFSLPLLFANGMSFISSTLDTILIGAFLSSQAVGIYGAAYPLARLSFLAPGLLGVIFTPVISELHSSGQLAKIRDVYAIVTKWIVILTLPGVATLALHPDLYLEFVFGSEYVSGATALTILSLGFFVHIVMGINGGTLKMLGESNYFLLSSVVNAVLNIALNLWLIPRIGIVGAAVATAVSYTAGNSLVSLRLYTRYRISPITLNNLGTYLLYVAALLVSYLALYSILDGIIFPITVYVVSMAAFLAVYVRSRLPTESERELLDDYRGKLQETL